MTNRGAGKTYTAAVLAEEFFKTGIPFVVFDPIDVWWGLRVSKDGTGKGLPVVVFGLEHADIPLERDMGRQIAQAIVAENVSCIISTFGMPKVAQRQLPPTAQQRTAPTSCSKSISSVIMPEAS